MASKLALWSYNLFPLCSWGVFWSIPHTCTLHSEFSSHLCLMLVWATKIFNVESLNSMLVSALFPCSYNYGYLSFRLFPIVTQNWLISLRISLMERVKFGWLSVLVQSLTIMTRASMSWSLLRLLKRWWLIDLRLSSKLIQIHNSVCHIMGHFGTLMNFLKLPNLICQQIDSDKCMHAYWC